MRKPPTLAEVTLAKDGENVHTFSNGSEWDSWASRNCYRCKFFNEHGSAGALCAFEAAAFIHAVTPELAELFGWQRDEYGDYDAPKQCAFFQRRSDDNDNDREDEPPPVCPETLSLFADQRSTRDITVPMKPTQRTRDTRTPHLSTPAVEVAA